MWTRTICRSTTMASSVIRLQSSIAGVSALPGSAPAQKPGASGYPHQTAVRAGHYVPVRVRHLDRVLHRYPYHMLSLLHRFIRPPDYFRGDKGARAVVDKHVLSVRGRSDGLQSVPCSRSSRPPPHTPKPVNSVRLHNLRSAVFHVIPVRHQHDAVDCGGWTANASSA